MENRRDDVIVIFAGYPDKMNEFLDKNEGLRSRIAFYLDFPDYNADELMKIMQLMLKKRGLHIDKEAKEKALGLFQKACAEKDFGNGRFVRNLLDQAMLRQATRLLKNGRNVSKTGASRLVAGDFDVNIAGIVERKAKRTIGFVV